MKIERALQINIAMLSVTSALLYSMGQAGMHLAMLVMLAAATSIWITDSAGWIRLSRLVASILAVGVFVLVVRQMFSLDNVTAIKAIARLLIYLQVILFFQRKDNRVYWQLIVLSLLLLVVATVFSQGALFGMLMVVYLFMAISAMALLFLHREMNRYVAGETEVPEQPSPETDDRRWPLGAQSSYFVDEVAHNQHKQSRPGREFLRRLVNMGLSTLVFTAVIFFIMPRLGQPAWRSPFHKQRRMVGYSGEVELGELGRVIDDPAEVLRISFTDPATDRMYSIDGAVYLHGTVLTRYAERSWTFPGAPIVRRDIEMVDETPPGEIVAQSVTIEPMDRSEVFCVQPFFAIEGNPALRYDPIRQSLLRAMELCGRRFRFALRTNAFREGRQRSLSPAPRKSYRLGSLLQLPKDQLPTLVALADEWMAETSLSEDRRIDRARYLESKLRNSGKFQYSMQAQRQDFEIDPIEDFVKNVPEGHCEYFATALTLMLRSQGIPARLVVGYKCDEFNPLAKYFQVRQLHAHTWVEAYIPPEQVPLSELQEAAGTRTWDNGAWLRLDPTPGGDEGQLGAGGQLMATAGKSVDWLQYVWNSYVMEMDRSRQREAIYTPLVDWAEGTYDRLTSLAWWAETGRQFLELIDPRRWNVAEWFSWRGGLVGVCICLGLVALFRVARFAIRRVRRWIGSQRRKMARAARTRVEFYRRFQAILGRRGMRRQVGQTQREFARAVGGRFAAELTGSELAVVPEQVTEAFYRVRFGEHPLDKSEGEAVELALSRLEEALDRRRQARERG